MKRGAILLYRFYINNVDNDYHYGELIRVFIPDDDFEVLTINFTDCSNVLLGPKHFIVNSSCSDDRDTIKRELYHILESITGLHSDWGTLTGVRPLKLAFDIYNKYGSINLMKQELSSKYLVDDSKINLLTEILEYQLKYITGNPSEKIGLYVGIPFCPTRCAYCSFASNVAGGNAIAEYFSNLLKEVEYTGRLAVSNNTDIESIYIGGGTPTTLSAEQIGILIDKISDCFGIIPSEIEFTIEAGRPDTITREKLSIMKEHGISRISINPQTMKGHTLELIGRNHKPEDIINAYNLSSEYKYDVINADLICGLPEETLDDFKDSLEKVIELGANNITVHTLSVKRGTRLKDSDPEYYRRNTESVKSMLDYAHDRLSQEGFYPYYIYRQKHQIGALENVGYCKESKHSIYNVRIMEEKQTIIALGAGGIGKVYFPDEDRLERIPNVSNYQVYNERFDEMLDRKNKYYGG